MAEAIVGPLVGRLQELALGQARALVGVNADIQKLKDKLMWLQAFLREADAKRRAVSDEVTKVWVLQTRDAVFDAEDALDHYYLQLDKSRTTMLPRKPLAMENVGVDFPTDVLVVILSQLPTSSL
uniref:Disease resistance N-terminal domain-containing protein n=1 Tax=Oryza nivara TaxID=4536 RepID=A0A0E0I175_ORYNI